MLRSLATGIGHRFSSMAAEFRPLVRFTRVLRLHVLVLEQTPLQLPLVVAVVVLLVVETQLTANFPFFERSRRHDGSAFLSGKSDL